VTSATDDVVGNVSLRLTQGNGSNIQPAFSPDGKKIVFISNRDGNREIYLMNRDGSGQQRLTRTVDIQEDLPNFSLDGTQILYGGTSGGQEDLYLMRVNGSEVINLTNTPDRSEGRGRFSPSGQYIVYDSDVSGNWEIHIAKLTADGLSNMVQLTRRPDFRNRLPSFSPLGDVIIFRSELISGGMEGSGIHMIRPDGTGLVSLASGERDFFPSISPDGQTILFLSDRNGSSEIYYADLDGNNMARLTYDNKLQDYAVFDPSGAWIVYAELGDIGGYDIYLMSLAQE